MQSTVDFDSALVMTPSSYRASNLEAAISSLTGAAVSSIASQVTATLSSSVRVFTTISHLSPGEASTAAALLDSSVTSGALISQFAAAGLTVSNVTAQPGVPNYVFTSVCK